MRGVGIGCSSDEANWAGPRKEMADVIGACPPKLTAWSLYRDKPTTYLRTEHAVKPSS